MRERRRRAHAQVECSAAAKLRVGERVEEEDDVGVPLRALLVDPQLAAARRRAPVDATRAVAGRPGANVRELDPVALRARDLVPDEDLRLERDEERVERLDAGIHAQGRATAEPRLPR